MSVVELVNEFRSGTRGKNTTLKSRMAAIYKKAVKIRGGRHVVNMT